MVGNQVHVHDAKPDHLGNVKPGSSGIACQMTIVRNEMMVFLGLFCAHCLG